MPQKPTVPTAVFFDLDDTLLNDHAASSHGLRTLMERLGHPDFDAARTLWDIQTDLSFNAYLTGRLTLAEQRRERVRALATQAGHSHIADQHCDELYQRYLDAHRAAWQAFDDVAPALAHLTAHNIRLGVITNGIQALQHDKLATMNITHHFATVVCSDTAGTGKPDPRIFHLACHQLGVAPDKAWHVGDQIRADALGAANAGLYPVLCDRRDNPAADITTIRALNELAPLLSEAQGAEAGLL
ncbi:HAD family hydrolase [Actinorugispora endophytica]|uniref:Putative hydrolase of the HAD superfamily n=1 Tax=Actinorugispora endophytica TaxID=1605990 RepID=A0A4R6UTX5_9ACTN|nr:HAD family hydrolase [Actinorugispora endophytica]TDQ50710.1 putative hydrolase of the HAD superfamily [Actinorugispora endophytica]